MAGSKHVEIGEARLGRAFRPPNAADYALVRQVLLVGQGEAQGEEDDGGMNVLREPTIESPGEAGA